MGESVDSKGQPAKGVWAYMRGGMGTISESIAAAGREAGAEIVCNASVKSITLDGDAATGVEMADGSRIAARTVLSGASPYHTFLELMPGLSRDSGNLEEQVPSEAVEKVPSLGSRL